MKNWLLGVKSLALKRKTTVQFSTCGAQNLCRGGERINRSQENYINTKIIKKTTTYNS